MSIQKWGSPNSLALAIDFCDTHYFFLNWFIKFISALCYSSGSSSSTKCRGRASSSTICTPRAKASFLSTLTRYRHSRNCRAFAISRRCTMMEGETSAQCAFSRAILSASRRGTPPPALCTTLSLCSGIGIGVSAMVPAMFSLLLLLLKTKFPNL
jgi:hypothetical protein